MRMSLIVRKIAGKMTKTGKDSIGTRITELRKKQNITKAELSRKAGLKQPMITNYEANGSDPSATVVVKLAKALNTSTDYLLTGFEGTGKIEDQIAVLTEQDKTYLYQTIELLLTKYKYGQIGGHFTVK